MRKMIYLLGFATLASGMASAALAQQQRDPAYQAARDAGQVGEMPDGYLGIVGTPTPALRTIVNSVNIQRKKVYTDNAEGATIEQFAFVTGCNLITATKPGEKYQTPDGRWMTRDASAPLRDPRCA